MFNFCGPGGRWFKSTCRVYSSIFFEAGSHRIYRGGDWKRRKEEMERWNIELWGSRVPSNFQSWVPSNLERRRWKAEKRRWKAENIRTQPVICIVVTFVSLYQLRIINHIKTVNRLFCLRCLGKSSRWCQKCFEAWKIYLRRNFWVN